MSHHLKYNQKLIRSCTALQENYKKSLLSLQEILTMIVILIIIQLTAFSDKRKRLYRRNTMLYHILEKLDSSMPFLRAKAHCDIPCGIYDPIVAQIAALTVVRMIDLMNDLRAKGTEGMDYENSMSRYITVKEEHAEKAKHEIRIIWGDYIKAQHLEAHPELHEITHKIMSLGSKARQTTDRAVAVEFVEAINRFAEVFWATKNIPTKRAKAPYAPALELVYPVL